MATIVVGKQVQPIQNPTNTFEFVISLQSGDTKNNSFTVQDAEEAINLALLLECIKFHSDSYHIRIDDMIKAVTENLSADVIQSAIADCDLGDCIWDLVGDYKYHGDELFLVALDDYEIFWYNEFGIKFEASLVK